MNVIENSTSNATSHREALIINMTHSDTNQHGEGAQKAKRKPVRRDAEKRRQQNIQAQRRYREKLRQRMENLEALAATAQQQPTSTTVTPLVQDTPDFSVVPSSTAPSSDSFSSFDQSALQMNIGEAWDHSFWEFVTVSPSSLNLSDSAVGSSSSPELSITGPDIITVDCACDKPHLQISCSTQRQSCGGHKHVDVTLLNIGSLVPEAGLTTDPYINHIRLDSVCTLAAIDVLRMQVGLTEDMMCSEDFPSPFYRPMKCSANQTPQQHMVLAVQRMFSAVQPDLQPCTEQVTIEHAPWIDALPFKILRRNLILQKDQYESTELVRDLVSGLVCWGGAGLAQSDRDALTGTISTGTPWDSRSWEAKPWFLKKYSHILGGENGELVRQSEWWRGIRGEVVSLDFAESVA